MSDLDFGRLRELRATRPQAVAEAAVRRQRRPLLGGDGRLMIVAADHPARGALGVRTVVDAMGDRYDLLRRLVTALRRPGVDGVLGTPDILEDLLLLGALDNKVVIGSMNRGGLQGSSFELDDRFTGYDAASIAAMGFDGGKMLTRIDLADPGTVATLEASGRAVTELAAHGIMAMVEPFLSRRVDGRVVNDLSAAAVVKSVTIASGLGVTSAYTWLKLPVVDDMATVMAATTLPTLLLGGDPSGHPEETYAKWRGALALPGVRGLVVGRALLYPPDGDVAAAVDEAVSLVRADLGVTA
jgi:DhnA family fructose-bisphosphate aldolase class Ia